VSAALDAARPSTNAPGRAAVLARLLRPLSFLRWGLAGQLLTLVAMLVPILLREADQVAWLVVASAIATLLTNPAVLAHPFIYPVLRGPGAVRAANRASLVSLVVVCLLLLTVTPLEPHLGLPRGLFAATTLMLLGGGSFAMALSALVRAGDTRWIGIARFGYGVLLLALTLLAGLRPLGALSLVVASGLAYLLAAALVASRPGARPAPGPRAAVPARLVRAYLRRSLRPTTATIASSWALFLPSLALPGLGAAAGPWGVVTRIGGGFSTLLITLVTPPLEGRMSAAVRERDGIGFARAQRTALLLGTATGFVAVGAGLVLALYVEGNDRFSGWLLPISVAAVLTWVPLLALTPVNRTPNFLARDGARLAWDSARAVLMTGAFLATDGVTRLVVLGAVLTVSGVVFLPLTRYRRA
jgi:hypothetical protein